MIQEIQEVNELLADEKDKEIIQMANEDMARLEAEQQQILNEAHQISLPSNLYAYLFQWNYCHW